MRWAYNSTVERKNMSITEYNIRILISHLVILSGTLWIFLEWIHLVKRKTPKIMLMLLSIMILLSFLFSLFANLSYHDKVSISGKIIDISHTGSIAGLFDSYAVRIEDSYGITKWYHTSIFSSSSFKNSVRQLEIGETVNLYANNFFDLFYKYEKINIE